MILGKTALGSTIITTTLCNEPSVLLPFKWLLWRWGPSFANLKATLVRQDGHRMSMRQLACYLSAISLKLKGLKLVCDNIVINCEKFQPPKITNLLLFPEILLPSTEIHINSLHSESSQKLHLTEVFLTETVLIDTGLLLFWAFLFSSSHRSRLGRADWGGDIIGSSLALKSSPGFQSSSA